MLASDGVDRAPRAAELDGLRRRFVEDVGEATIRAITFERPQWRRPTAFDDPHADRERLHFALDEALRSGRLVPVRIEPVWRGLDPPPSVIALCM